MSGSVEVNFVPNLMQKQFIESQAKADLFSSRMGEGKSAGLCWASFYHVRHNPGAYHAFIRDTWENIRDTTLKEFMKWFTPGVFGLWNESKKTFTWAEGIASGTVTFMGMDDPGDAGKLQSRELGGFFMDEPAPAAQSGGIPEMVFDIGLSRLRQKDMKWYPAKLATNNPDEAHWTYRRFVDPGDPEFKAWQPPIPENERNLPADYYSNLRRMWGHRPDLVARFIEGQYGLTSEGKIVTPNWSDKMHLATGLAPIRGLPLYLLWDFGLNPTCIITQVTPNRHWLILDAMVGEQIGVEELIVAEVKPLLASKYRGYRWSHIGDPNGLMREQSSSKRSAVLTIRKELGGTFRKGPISLAERIDPLNAVLRQTSGGTGVVQVDRRNARAIWLCLRGGWHYHVSRTGVTSTAPAKDIHSHPGDAMGYGAAVLFPLGRLQSGPSGKSRPSRATFFGDASPSVGPTPHHGVLPRETRTIG